MVEQFAGGVLGAVLVARDDRVGEPFVEVGAPDLWDDQENAQRVTSSLSRANAELERVEGMDARIDDLDLRGAELHVLGGLDGLRGAALTELQLGLMLPLFAQHFGVRVLG